MIPPPRPMSRASLGGARTPLGLRSRSSLSGSLHGMSGMYAASGAGGADEGEDSFVEEFRSPSRTGTAPSGIPVPSSRRQSGVSGIPVPSSSGLGGGRRISGGGTAVGAGASQKLRQSQQGAAAADLGETY